MRRPGNSPLRHWFREEKLFNLYPLIKVSPLRNDRFDPFPFRNIIYYRAVNTGLILTSNRVTCYFEK